MSARQVPNYRLYREKTGESEDFWLHSETLPVRSRLHNWEISLHRHEALFQMFVLEAGEGELLSGAKRTPFAAPSAIYVPPGAAHGFRFSRDADGLVLTVLADRLPSIRASDAAVDAYLSGTQVTPLDGDGADGVLVAALAARIHGELHGAGPGSDILLDAMVTEIVLRLARTGARAEDADEPAAAGRRDRQRMHALTALLAAHCREHQPVGFYAGRLGLSPVHLNRIARREAGASVQELAQRHLLRAARRDLVFTPSPVQAIAYSLGFQDPAYFNRFFKRQTGMTPGAFREEERRKLVKAPAARTG
ncbi:helix-turn-helix domain-containing protein [Chelativorans salis]|uniref:Helix-turn-helix domain-containing protein n=1 Tax=Chelativorans salis TaxID=2978478 RepID=A0ABT2LK29_9HYPH|nr:helix-turn-helix domain-containing protein [Chelativorans sp. EGI FJ00035]MCT7374962.1 helix-turn-helix domain-containing protein [Chelativorans sp. EGI FJ00035]